MRVCCDARMRTGHKLVAILHWRARELRQLCARLVPRAIRKVSRRDRKGESCVHIQSKVCVCTIVVSVARVRYTISLLLCVCVFLLRPGRQYKTAVLAHYIRVYARTAYTVSHIL